MKKTLFFTCLLFISLTIFGQGVGISTTAITPNTTLDVNGDFSLRQGSNIVLTNGTNNDVVIGDYSFYKITGPTATFSITGFSGGVDGKIIVIYNLTNQPMIIANNSSLSSANNRVFTLGGDILTPADSSSLTLQYSATENKWIVIASHNSSSVQMKGNYSAVNQVLAIGAGVPAINYTTIANLTTSNFVSIGNTNSGGGQVLVSGFVRIYSVPTTLIAVPTNETHHFIIRVQRAEDAAFTIGLTTLCQPRGSASSNNDVGDIFPGYVSIPISYVDAGLSPNKTYYYRYQVMMNTVNPTAGSVTIQDRSLNLLYIPSGL